MKRFNEGVAGVSNPSTARGVEERPEVAGHPRNYASPRQTLAGPASERSVGRASAQSTGEVASFLDLRDVGRQYPAGSIFEEFSEFLADDDDWRSLALAPPDPIFRERLKRRLWRMHQLLVPPNSRGKH